MNFGLQAVWFPVFLIWLIVLSLLLYKLYARYTSLIKDSKDQTLAGVLERIVKEAEKSHRQLASLENRLARLEETELSHIQKTGLVRFNPFQDTGGEQSFILALLDDRDTGVVISGLYARSGMRWYIKKVAGGKGLEHELSAEEKKAVESAD